MREFGASRLRMCHGPRESSVRAGCSSRLAGPRAAGTQLFPLLCVRWRRRARQRTRRRAARRRRARRAAGSGDTAASRQGARRTAGGSGGGAGRAGGTGDVLAVTRQRHTEQHGSRAAVRAVGLEARGAPPPRARGAGGQGARGLHLHAQAQRALAMDRCGPRVVHWAAADRGPAPDGHTRRVAPPAR